MGNVRYYYKKSSDIYEKLSLVQAPLGRSLHHMGKLLSQHGDPEGEEYIKQAEAIYDSVSSENFNPDEDEPFRSFVHVFYS